MRRFFLEDLVRWKGEKKRKPLLLIGPRQVGKTYLLKEFGKTSFPQAHYINFEKEPKLFALFNEDLNPKRIVEELSFHLDRVISDQDLLIFDEIQACPLALTSLKYFAEEMPQLAVVGAGSLLGIHLAPVSFPVGKVTIKHLNPMTFEEFLLACGDEKSVVALQGEKIAPLVHDHLGKRLKEYFVVGGMPEAVSTYSELKEDRFIAFRKVREKQEELIIAYYADMAKHAGKVNALHIERVFRSVPAQLQRNVDGSSSKFRFKDVLPNQSRYQRLAGAIDWLVAAGLVYKVHIVSSGHLPLQAHINESAFKLFLFDIGILGSMCGLAPQTLLDADYGSYKGYFAENYVAQALMSHQRQELFCWQEKTAEVEFVREIEGEVVPIEVKSGTRTKSKSLGVFAKKYQPKHRIIFSQNPMSRGKEISYLPLYVAR